MIELEGAEAARATATGMAAVTTAMLAPLKAGDHVVASKQVFGSCRYVAEDLLPRYGIESTLVDGLDLGQWRKAMRPQHQKPVFWKVPPIRRSTCSTSAPSPTSLIAAARG